MSNPSDKYLVRAGGPDDRPQARPYVKLLAERFPHVQSVALQLLERDPEFRELAVLLSVMQSLPDADPKTAIERLQPLTASGNPWRASALDLTAAAKLKAGDRTGALEIYQKLADDLAAPQGLRARAAEMAAALKS